MKPAMNRSPGIAEGVRSIPAPAPIRRFRQDALLYIALFLLCLCLLPADTLRAQTPQRRREGARYLFVVETSSAMRPRAENAINTVGAILVNGMQGQLQPGDTIGFWTFNDLLHTGKFPLQLWTPAARRTITIRAVQFLRAQPMEKRARLDLVLPALHELITNSERLTIIIVSTGEQKIRGTPFDQQINTTYEHAQSELKKSDKPFVTVLRSYNGKFIGGSATWFPWPLEFAAFPPEPKITEPPKEEPKARPHPTAKPLIVIGKKPEPEKEPPPAVAPATEETKPKEVGPAPAQEPANTRPIEPAEPAKTEPKPTPVEPAPSTQVKPSATTTTAPKKSVVAMPAEEPASTAPSPATIVTSSAASAETESVANPQSEATPEPQSPIPPIETGTAAPSETVFGDWRVWAAASAGFLVVLVVIYSLVRRSRSTTRISLITRSMDQNK